MADTLRTRVARVIAGGAHALLDKIEDAAPMAMMEQSIRSVEVITDEVRVELGLAVANRHLAQQRHVSLNNEHAQLEASIAQALTSSRDDLAKSALSRQMDIEAQLPVLEGSLSDFCAEEKELSGFVDALMGKQREMQQAMRDLESSRHNAQASALRKADATSQASAKLYAAQSAFDRNYQRQTGLSGASHGASMQQAAKLKELNDMVRENKLNERLAALKAA
jgi:phage shock protein A